MKRTTNTNSGTALAVIPQPQQTSQAKKQPAAEQIEEMLKRLVAGEVEQFNCDLEIARRVYRSNPKLVQSPHYPEPWRTLYMEENEGQTPSDLDTQKAPSIAQLRKQELPRAIELATELANKGETGHGEAPQPESGNGDRLEAMRKDALAEVQYHLSTLGKMGPYGTFISLADAILLRDIFRQGSSFFDGGGLLPAIEKVAGPYLSHKAIVTNG